jgi:protein subunit release factor B
MTTVGTSGSSFTPLEESQRAEMSAGVVRPEGGYYRWEEATILFPKSVYEVKTSRGGGPGGQGVNSSSNKVELRIHLSKMVDEGVLDGTTKEELEKTAAKFLTADKEILLISCHEHRSASENTAACFAKAKQLIKDASYVPPLSTPELKANYAKLNHAIDRKRKKANTNKIQNRLKAERRN